VPLAICSVLATIDIDRSILAVFGRMTTSARPRKDRQRWCIKRFAAFIGHAEGQQARTGSHPAGLRSGDLCPPGDRGERIIDRWVDEAEAALQGGYRHHSLAIEQKFFSERAERDTEWPAGIGRVAGRARAQPNAATKAAFVTGTGAVALTGPNGLGVVIA
jgi:hypothetical protein